MNDQLIAVTRARLRAAKREYLAALRAWTKLCPKGDAPMMRPEVERVQRLVARHFSLPPSALWGPDRDDHTAKARHMAITILRRATKIHATEIIAAFRRTRPMMKFALAAHDQRCATDEQYRKDYDVLFAKCRESVARGAA